MKKNLQVGDLVWYNVGGNGKETVGFIIDQKKVVWRCASPWEDADKAYKNIVRIQWLRKGKLVPKPIPVPFYDSKIALLEAASAHNTVAEYGGEHYDPDAIYKKDWYEGQWFKVISSVDKK